MILGAIPSRWSSTRFPGKALAEIAGVPLVGRVVQAALCARTLDAVVVVTDHAGIALAAESAGARAVVIEREAASGTDRIAQLLATDRACGEARIVVNVQGDEPLLEPAAIDAAVEALERDPDSDIATLARRGSRARASPGPASRSSTSASTRTGARRSSGSSPPGRHPAKKRSGSSSCGRWSSDSQSWSSGSTRARSVSTRRRTWRASKPRSRALRGRREPRPGVDFRPSCPSLRPPATSS